MKNFDLCIFNFSWDRSHRVCFVVYKPFRQYRTLSYRMIVESYLFITRCFFAENRLLAR